MKTLKENVAGTDNMALTSKQLAVIVSFHLASMEGD